ncbi:unnamed protein product [Rotaria sp. Silwood1]|nr:unnamed protein product [Rotaria sp. Silwood1]CAF4929280.1 unnamed protein product [Rotaria sp. Silwood1]
MLIHGTFRSKNPRVIAYLLAIKHGARFIYEFSTNISFHYYQNIQYIAFRRERSPFINIYPTFTANFNHCSPGLPKDELLNITEDGWSSIRIIDPYQETIHPLIQQQILIYDDKEVSLVNHPPVGVEPFTFAPFSSQNILFAYDAFWGLVLPSSKSDIWRSWWVQRLLWDINAHVVFTSIAHEINMTMTIDDKKNEKEDANVGKLVRFLSTWKSTKMTLVERIEQLINDMIEEKFCDVEEQKVVKDWIDDLKTINYVFPSIKNNMSQSRSSGTLRRRRIAVCMTGIIECIEEVWKPTMNAIRTHVKGEMDIFLYLSSSEPFGSQMPNIPLHIRLVEALRYPNFTVKVLFENIPKLDPHFPPNCTTDANVDQPDFKIPRYYQQLFGLSNCFSLVRDYEKRHNIKYDIMVRLRADLQFLQIPATFDRESPFDINTTMILPPNRYGSRVNDGFAIGPIDLIEVYMNRYYAFRECLTRDLHPERYLYFYLNYRKVKMTIDGTTVVEQIPHSPKSCH